MRRDAWNNRDRVELRRCRGCRFVYSALANFDYDAFTCDDTYVSRNREGLLELARQDHIPELMDEVVAKARLSGGRVLDIGCGMGLAALYLQDKGFEVYGVEESRIYLEKHKELNLASASHVESLGLDKGGVDLLVMKDVLEHINDPRRMLDEVLSYVRPNGYLFLRVPNVFHYYFHWAIDTKSHVNHFAPGQLSRVLATYGLRRVDFVTIRDISTTAGKLYNFIFWRLRKLIPMYHQISVLYQKN
jgi:2-polyprenyl-3-methyl-5-hydroxy-6-metoxy-1,4-benzoquinol methylase